MVILTPPELRLSQCLSAWLGCSLEVRCAYGRSTIPLQMLLERHGNVSLAQVLGALRCQVCRRPPAPVYLVAGLYRRTQPGAGSVGDWAAEMVREPRE